MSLQTEADDRLLGFSDSDLLLLYNLLSGKAQTGCWTGGKTQRVWETASFSQSLNQSALNSAENLPVLHVWAALLRIRPSFTLFIPAGANKTMQKKKKFKCVRKKRRNASSAARVTHLSAPRRSASLPAQKVSLPPRWRLLSRHPQQRASSCCQQRQRERAQIQKKTKLKKFWYLIKSVSTLYKNNWSFERTQRNNSSGVFQRNQLTRSKDCRWKMYVIMWHHPMVSGLHTSLCTFLCLFVVQVLFKHKVCIYIKKTWRCSCSAPFTQSAFESKEWKVSVILSEHCCRPGCDISPPLFLS